MKKVHTAVLILTAILAVPLSAVSQHSKDVLKVSTLVTASDILRRLSADEEIDKTIRWCKDTNITKVYIESFRDGQWVDRQTLDHLRDRFKDAGLEVSGGVTTTGHAKRSTGKPYLACYSSQETRLQLQKIFEFTASVFDEIMIDDFFYTDCECSQCTAGKNSDKYKRFHADSLSWADYRCDLMVDVAKKCVIQPAKNVNPNVKIILKYPQWYDRFQKRGYDVVRQTAVFDTIWVGTETRDPNSTRFGNKNQYEAYYIMRWLGEIGGDKCGGGWFDRIDTSPRTYLEQARQTILGGAKEMMLFSCGSMQRETSRQHVDALRSELPALRELARLIHDRKPLGIAAPKPPNSEHYTEQYIYDFVGMMGLPLVPTATFDPAAHAAFLPVHTLKDPDIRKKIDKMLADKKPVLITDGLAKRLDGFSLSRENLYILNVNEDPYTLHNLTRAELKQIRDKMLAPFGLMLDAPNKIALYLFDNDLAVIENFNDEPVTAALTIESLTKADITLTLPEDAPVKFTRKDHTLEFSQIPPRTLVAISYR